jgi:hypothetical protein
MSIKFKSMLAFSLFSLAACTAEKAPLAGSQDAVAAPAPAIRVPVREYDCDGVRLTLDADGSASLHFQNGDRRNLNNPFEAAAQPAATTAATPKNASLNNASFTFLRLHAAMKNLVTAVSLEVVAEQSTKSRQATQVATHWLSTRTIAAEPKSASLPPATHPLSTAEETTLKNALSGQAPTLPPAMADRRSATLSSSPIMP